MAEENRDALLTNKNSYEDCPGCKVEEMKQWQRGFPFKEIFSIWVIVICTAVPITSLFPFIYFMVKDFHIAKMEEDIGFYAGFVGSAYMLGRALTSMFWGVAADRFGRKPVLLVGTISIVFFNTLFGLSVNFWMAITTRFLLGCFNSLLGPIKAYASEIVRDEHQALALSAVGTAWGVGLIAGPAIGGFLAQPAVKYPDIFSQESLFGRFPYFLPCLCTSIFALVVSFIVFQLPETLHNHSKDTSHGDSYEALEAAALNGSGKAEEKSAKSSSEDSLFKNWPLMSSIIVYCVVALHDMSYSEIFSLWAVSPRKFGGLSYSTEEVGEILAISGVSLLIFQLSLYGYLEKILGPIKLTRISGALVIPLLSSFPFIAKLSGFTLYLSINCASILKNVLTVSTTTGLIILQNRAVEQNRRGAANGISMTAMSLFKAIGPAGAGVLFSWTEKRQDASFLPGSHMMFFILNAILAVGVVMTFKPFLVEAQPKTKQETGPGGDSDH